VIAHLRRRRRVRGAARARVHAAELEQRRRDQGLTGFSPSTKSSQSGSYLRTPNRILRIDQRSLMFYPIWTQNAPH
jgi:hypothetical protein